MKSSRTIQYISSNLSINKITKITNKILNETLIIKQNRLNNSTSANQSHPSHSSTSRSQDKKSLFRKSSLDRNFHSNAFISTPTTTNTNPNTTVEPPFPYASTSTSTLPILIPAQPIEKLTFSNSLTSATSPPAAIFSNSLPIKNNRNQFSLKNGAYGIPKVKLSFESNASLKGKDKERVTIDFDQPLSVGIGEDAYFLRSDSLGVADGVGGWSGHAGANPARWSRKLMQHCSAELARYDNAEDELFLEYDLVDPIEILQRAFETSLLECKDEGVIGSSTALLAILRNDELRIANMGDCCISIIRDSNFIFRSEEQQHSFNFPVQLGTNSKDVPKIDGQTFKVKVQKNDIIILCSDGLVDNLFDEDILEEILHYLPTPVITTTATEGEEEVVQFNAFSPEIVSEILCLRAKSVYEDPSAVASPFQQRAMEEGIHFAGGKRDDITTIIGIIS